MKGPTSWVESYHRQVPPQHRTGSHHTTDLGVTLMHEHVFIMTTEILQNYPEAWGDGIQTWPMRSFD
jgi:hypothetical protein